MSGPSPKKPVAAAAKAAPVSAAKPPAAVKRPIVSAAAALGAAAATPSLPTKHQAVAATTSGGKPVLTKPTEAAASESEEDESKEPHEAIKSVVHAAATTDPATSTTSTAPVAAVTTVYQPTAAELREQKLMRQMNRRYDLIIKDNPSAIVPPYMWIGYMKIQLKKLRESKIYFRKINTNLYNPKFPDLGGDIIYQQSESSLAGATDTSMHLINARLKKGDEGFGSHFIRVQGPPMVISHGPRPLGTFRDPNPKLTANTENKFFPDQHMHMWSHISKSYFISTGLTIPLIDSECEAFERWLYVAQMNYLLILIDSDQLKRSLKPKLPPGQTTWERTPKFYQHTLDAFRDKFRLVKFDEYIREQKALANGESGGEDKSVRDVERVSGGDAARVDLHSRLFMAGDNNDMSLDSDDEEDWDIENDASNKPKAASSASKKAAAAAGNKQAAKGPVASLEYMAEKFTAATDVVLSKDQIDEYAEMQKSNKNILNIMCNKLYCTLVDALPGYDRSKDEYRKDLNLGMEATPQRVRVRLFPHPDSPWAPKGMCPYRTDTVEPHFATGSLSSKQQVFNYGKKRVLADPKLAAKWAKQLEQFYKTSPVTQRTPVLDRLYKERGIVIKNIPTYAGFCEDPCDLLEIHHRDGDVEAHIFHLRATLNAPVMVGKPPEQVIYSNMKLDTVSTRTFLRAPDARVDEVTGRGHTTIGKISYAGASSLLTKHNLGDATSAETAKADAASKMVIVHEGNGGDSLLNSEASKSWSQDTRDMIHDLMMDDVEWVAQLPTFSGTNKISLVKDLKKQCGLLESSKGPYELSPAETDRFYNGMVQAAQLQVTDGAANSGDHLSASLNASRQIKDPATVRKQLAAASRGASVAASSVPTSAPNFGNDDDDEEADMIDAGAEYE